MDFSCTGDEKVLVLCDMYKNNSSRLFILGVLDLFLFFNLSDF